MSTSLLHRYIYYALPSILISWQVTFHVRAPTTFKSTYSFHAINMTMRARAREFSFFLNETLFLILQFFSPLALYACSNDVLARNGIA